jgi:hybrid cluster-associated redox disulfide protein
MKITKEMTIAQVIKNKPESVEILRGFGMGCVGCPSAQAETLEEASMVHGFSVDQLLDALNKNSE